MSRWARWGRCLPWKSRAWRARISIGSGCWNSARSPPLWSSTRMGCYDPADFNDGLLLGLKGVMASAELHFLRARLQGGKLHKAQKGELRFPLPVGFCYDAESRIIQDS